MNQQRKRSQRSRAGLSGVLGFTLIELLVVVAIISILAGIAVPNFLEAQTRAKVSRIKADMRTLVTGLESYRIDHNGYPVRTPAPLTVGTKSNLPYFPAQARDWGAITTPVAFLTSIPVDIFTKSITDPRYLIDYFGPIICPRFIRRSRNIYMMNHRLGASRYDSREEWVLISVGPDGYLGLPHGLKEGSYPPQGLLFNSTSAYTVYDPTNGTGSLGNIFRFGSGKDPFLHLLKD